MYLQLTTRPHVADGIYLHLNSPRVGFSDNVAWIKDVLQDQPVVVFIPAEDARMLAKEFAKIADAMEGHDAQQKEAMD